MTHSTNGKHKPAHLSPRHPDQRSDEIAASEVARMAGVQRQTVLRRAALHPDKLPGRLLPYVPGLSGGARGLWVFRVADARAWQEERRAKQARRARKAKLRAEGFDVR